MGFSARRVCGGQMLQEHKSSVSYCFKVLGSINIFKLQFKSNGGRLHTQLVPECDYFYKIKWDICSCWLSYLLISHQTCPSVCWPPWSSHQEKISCKNHLFGEEISTQEQLGRVKGRVSISRRKKPADHDIDLAPIKRKTEERREGCIKI